MEDSSLPLSITLAVTLYAVVGYAGLLLFRRYARRQREHREDQRLVQVVRASASPEEWAEFWAHWTKASALEDRRDLLRKFMPSQWPTESPLSAGAPSEGGDEVPGDRSLYDRVAALEARIPSSAVIEKVASANEARMAVLIEHVERDLDRLATRTLTRGDVVGVVFAALGTVGALLAITTWALGQLSAAAGS